MIRLKNFYCACSLNSTVVLKMAITYSSLYLIIMNKNNSNNTDIGWKHSE